MLIKNSIMNTLLIYCMYSTRYNVCILYILVCTVCWHLQPDRAIFESSGVKRLNAMQSVVFNSAYRTNENLLVCAPTGAGKTNIALLCVLRAVRVHRQSLEADEGSSGAGAGAGRRRARAGPMAGFKVVYVAPMKALAAEMTATFSKRLAPLGLTARALLCIYCNVLLP